MFLAENALLPSGLSGEGRQRVSGLLHGTKLVVTRDPDWKAIFRALEWPHDIALICDNATWDALGKPLADAIQTDDFQIRLINLGSEPTASMDYVRYVMDHCHDVSALIAVGSGTLNDIVKYAAHKMGKPYAVCGTAPSMNGYLSANAAIMVEGHKQSLPATLAKAAMFDLDVLEAAPERMKQAGVGDSICRSTAQVDWLLSHLLLDTPYDALPFELLAEYEGAMLQGDMDALIKTLILSGAGMTLSGGSYPASQGEHLIAHYMEMRYPEIAHKTLHGEQIAVTALYMAKRQEAILARTIPPLVLQEDISLSEIQARFGSDTAMHIYKEYKAKQEVMAMAAERLNNDWGAIHAALKSIMVPSSIIERALQSAGVAYTPSMLGWSDEQFAEACHYARFIRNRFGFLDLAA